MRAVIAGGNRPPLTEARAETGGPLAVDEVLSLCTTMRNNNIAGADDSVRPIIHDNY